MGGLPKEGAYEAICLHKASNRFAVRAMCETLKAQADVEVIAHRRYVGRGRIVLYFKAPLTDQQLQKIQQVMAQNRDSWFYATESIRRKPVHLSLLRPFVPTKDVLVFILGQQKPLSCESDTPTITECLYSVLQFPPRDIVSKIQKVSMFSLDKPHKRFQRLRVTMETAQDARRLVEILDDEVLPQINRVVMANFSNEGTSKRRRSLTENNREDVSYDADSEDSEEELPSQSAEREQSVVIPSIYARPLIVCPPMQRWVVLLQPQIPSIPYSVMQNMPYIAGPVIRAV